MQEVERRTGQAAAGDDLRLQKLPGAVAIDGGSAEDVLVSLYQVHKLEGGAAHRVAHWDPAGPVSITLLHRVAADGGAAVPERRIPAAGDGGGVNLIKSDWALWIVRFS